MYTPTDPTRRRDHQRQLRFAAIVPVAVALAVVGLLALVVQWQRSQRTPRPIAPPDTMTSPYSPDVPDPLDDEHQPMLTPRSADELLLLHPGDQILEGEPADLPTINGGTRVGGFRRSAAGAAEEVSFWHSAESMDSIWAHYTDAAHRAGFSPLPARRQSPSRLFTRSCESGEAASCRQEVLTIRVTPGTEQNRIMVWLRRPLEHASRESGS